MVNVVCLKWGQLYGPDYVNKLYRGVARNLTIPFRFVCFTDDADGVETPVECMPLPPIELPAGYENSAFRKIALFAPEVADLSGPTLFMDLDVVIVDTIDCFFELQGPFYIIHNWIERRKTIFRPRPRIGNSSVFRFTIGEQAHVLEDFHARPLEAIHGYPTEQAYMSDTVSSLDFWPETWCRSFKKHCTPLVPLNSFVAPHLPEGAKIIVFHGRPNPDQAAGGFRSGWRKRTLPATWIDQYWV